MRRVLVPFLLVPLAMLTPSASAGPCDPEPGTCHPVDCLPWDPVGTAPGAVEQALRGDPAALLTLLPPACPA